MATDIMPDLTDQQVMTLVLSQTIIFQTINLAIIFSIYIINII